MNGHWMRGVASLLLWGFVAGSLSACATMRPYHKGRPTARDSRRDSGGDRSWLIRREPRVIEVSSDPETQSFERVRLARWKQVAQSIQLSWPLKRPRVTSRFGRRAGEPHDGVDFKAAVGTPVYASHDGKVLYSGSGLSGYGSLVVIRHPSGIATVYAHNSRIKVKKGQWVRRGQWIANSGATGRASGPHLHFEVRAGSRPLDPLALIPSSSSRGAAVRPALAALD